MTHSTGGAAQPCAELQELAFLIPVRIDTPDRLWNLATVLRFIEHRFTGADVVVIEQDGESRIGEVIAAHPGVKHLLRADGGAFCKSECVNLGATSTTRRFICGYDTDVLLAPAAIVQALRQLMHGGWRMVLPFNRIFLDVRGALRALLGERLDLGALGSIRNLKAAGSLEDASVRFVEGGIFIADRETFLAEGGLNAHMVSYGWEDTEMHKRFTKLGYPILHLSEFNLVHLDHSRGPDSQPNAHYDLNRREYLKVKAMAPDALARYVEEELSITARHQPASLAQLRRAQSRRNRLGLLRLRAFFALLRIHLQAHGVRAVAARLVRSRAG